MLIVLSHNLRLQHRLWQGRLSRMAFHSLLRIGSRHIEYWRCSELLQARNHHLGWRFPLIFFLLFRQRSLLKLVLNSLGNLSINLCQSVVNEAQKVFSHILYSGLRSGVFLRVRIRIVLRIMLLSPIQISLPQDVLQFLFQNLSADGLNNCRFVLMYRLYLFVRLFFLFLPLFYFLFPIVSPLFFLFLRWRLLFQYLISEVEVQVYFGLFLAGFKQFILHLFQFLLFLPVELLKLILRSIFKVLLEFLVLVLICFRLFEVLLHLFFTSLLICLQNSLLIRLISLLKLYLCRIINRLSVGLFESWRELLCFLLHFIGLISIEYGLSWPFILFQPGVFQFIRALLTLWVSKINSSFSLVLVYRADQLQVETLQFFIINSEVRRVYFKLSKDHLKVLYLSLCLPHYLAYIQLELSVVEITQFFVDFFLEKVHIDGLSLFLQVFFVGGKRVCIEGRLYLYFVQFGCSKLDLSLYLLRLFLVLHDLPFESIDSLCVALDVEVLQVFDGLYVLKSFYLIL